MVALKRLSIQLSALVFGDAIIASGGKVIVCKAGSPDKETLYSPLTELPIANPVALVRGKMEFCIPEASQAVDLYIQAPGGQFLVERGVKPSGPNEFIVDTRRAQHMYVLPFSIADTAANTETKTGISLPALSAVQPSPLVNVATQEGARTLTFGTDSGAGGSANGFIAGASLAAAGLVKPTLVNTGVTLGADLKVQDSANAGDAVPEQNIARAGKELTYTLSASTAAAKGFIYLPVTLAA